MDEKSTSFSWSGLFPESLSPDFEAVMPQETQNVMNRKSQVGNETTRQEIGPTCTFTDILVQDEHSETQTTNALERRPRGPIRQANVSGGSHHDRSAAGKSSMEVSTPLAYGSILMMIPRDQRLMALKRRRTQVKLAQRAYRQRKDDTLAALKKQCGDLKEVIRNINEAFNAFYSDTCHSGIASREPKHMHHLRQTAKYMGDLTDIALDEASKV